MTKVPGERRFWAAIAWAQAELEEVDLVEEAPRGAWLEALSDEWLKARRERRGMDPGLVRIAVQAIIDQTPSKGEPRNL